MAQNLGCGADRFSNKKCVVLGKFFWVVSRDLIIRLNDDWKDEQPDLETKTETKIELQGKNQTEIAAQTLETNFLWI